jgi:hypothetical protein
VAGSDESHEAADAHTVFNRHPVRIKKTPAIHQNTVAYSHTVCGELHPRPNVRTSYLNAHRSQEQHS